MRNPKIRKGQVFGSWTAIKEENRRALCVCECGNSRTVASKSLWSGKSKNCGCKRSEKLILRNRKSVMGGDSTRHELYSVWKGIKKRCLNKNCKSYKNYGGRGITICKRWEKSFRNFVEDMGERPFGHSIDRIDNNKGYSPDNCRWADNCQQSNNKRSSKYITHNGIKKTYAQWSLFLNGNKALVYNRIRKGWSEEQAVTKPVRGHE